VRGAAENYVRQNNQMQERTAPVQEMNRRRSACSADVRCILVG
jgi:hypothetical protein